MLRAVFLGIKTKKGGKQRDLGAGFGSPVAAHRPAAGTWPGARRGVAGAGPARRLHRDAAPPALGAGDRDGSGTAIPARPAPAEALPAPPAASASRHRLKSGG